MEAEAVLAAVKQHFGLDAAAMESLGSCQDINFKLKCADGRRFVVKYTNPTTAIEDVHFQHSVQWFLASSALKDELVFPVPLHRVDDPQRTTVEQTIAGQNYTMHVLSYVKGQLLDDFSYFPVDTLVEFGGVIAKLSAKLEEYSLSNAVRPRQSQWDIRRSLEMCQSHSGCIRDAAEKEKWMDLATQLFELVQAQAASGEDSLRVQLVHGDLAPYNVVAVHAENGRPKIQGVIDFGDVTESWLVGELAIAITPFISNTSRRPLDYVDCVVRGFSQVTPLSVKEAAALWPLIVLRTIVLYISVSSLIEADPENTYLKDEAVLNKRAAEYAIGVPLEIGIAAVMQAAELADHTHSHSVSPPMLSTQAGLLAGSDHAVDALDLSVTSDRYEDGDWLNHTHCFRKVMDALADGAREQRIPMTMCGSPWLLFSELRLLEAPKVIATFSLMGIGAGWSLLSPATGRRKLLKLEHLSGWMDTWNEAMMQWIAQESIESVLELELQSSWVVRVAGRHIGRMDSTCETGAVNAGDVILCNAESRSSIALIQTFYRNSGGLLPMTAPPLFCTGADWSLWKNFCIDPALLIQPGEILRPMSLSLLKSRDVQQLLEARYGSVAACQEHYFRRPPNIERGYRAFMYDVDGRAYLDMVNNVAIVGHCHEKVVAAAHRQSQLLNTNSRFVYRAMSDFAESILKTIPEEIRRQGLLNKVLFVNSGSEATDLALRIARTVASERHARANGSEYADEITRDTICIQGGYHGVTTASDEVSTTLNDNPRSLVTRAPWIHLVPMPNLFRGIYRGSQEGALSRDIAHRYAEFVRRKIQDLQAKKTFPSAFIAESLSGNAGGVEIPMGYLQEVYEAVRAAGGLCICDEVQVGYGRLGGSFWGFQEHGVVPDIITMAKASGNGHPFGFVIVGEDIVKDFRNSQGSFFSSAGGGPVSCVTGSAVLQTILDEQLQENARIVGAYLHEKLQELRKRHPKIVGYIHGHGLYQGVELVRNGDQLGDLAIPEPATAEAYAICERLLELGVINHNTGDYSNVLKIKPPLYFSKEDADFFVEALDIALQGW